MGFDGDAFGSCTKLYGDGRGDGPRLTISSDASVDRESDLFALLVGFPHNACSRLTEVGLSFKVRQEVR